jgi:hypothetical protein
VGIILMPIGGHLLMALVGIILMVIDGHSINGYWWSFY